jgi:Carboxypeptidase regulatory-like domain
VSEDWKDVQLSLIAGSPQSFVQQISQPYYTRRPVIGLPESIMLTPQAHEGTITAETGSGLGSGAAGGVVYSFAPGTGGLQGTITDQTGAVVAGAQVTIRNEETGASQTTSSDATGTYRFFNVPAGNSALFVSRAGFQQFNLTNFYLGVGRMNEIHAKLNVGSDSASVEVSATASRVQASSGIQTSSAMLTSGAEKQHVEAEGKDLGDYFEYNLKQKITIGRNQSALVPILQAHVDAEKITLWNELSKEIRRALWIKNSSGQTLDSGTFNIVEGDTFSGEGLFETMHANERRLISYAADPGVRIAMDEEQRNQPVSHVRIVKGSMFLTHERRDSRKYTIRNSDTQPRNVVIEHPARDGWKLAEGAKPEETTASFLRFRVSVPPGQTQELKIEEYTPDQAVFQLSELDDKEVSLISDQKTITPGLQNAFRRILVKKNEIGVLETQISTREQEVQTINNDQGRVRENMKALKGSAEEKSLVQRYTRQLEAQEDRLATLKRELGDLNDKKDKADEGLDGIIQEISLDESL